MNSGDRKGRRHASSTAAKHKHKQSIVSKTDEAAGLQAQEGGTDFPLALDPEAQMISCTAEGEPEGQSSGLYFSHEEDKADSTSRATTIGTGELGHIEEGAESFAPLPDFDHSLSSSDHDYSILENPEDDDTSYSAMDFSTSPRTDYSDSRDSLNIAISESVAGYAVERNAADIQRTIDEAVQSVVQLASYGAFNFLAGSSSLVAEKSGFDDLFRQQMELEFGAENGEFLYERYKRNRVSPNIKDKIEAIREYVTNLYRAQQQANQTSLKQILNNMMTTAFNNGGLNGVDLTIRQVNSGLRAIGSRYGLAPGCACENDGEGNPAWLAIMFSNLETNQLLSMEWCQLQGNQPNPL